MFGFGKSTNHYKNACSNPRSVYDLLYKDRTKTAEILGDEAFISAWLDSEKQQEITLIIRKEAMGGDVPSLKQMVWLLGNMQQEISAANIDKKQKSLALCGVLSERVSHCNSLISKGLLGNHYQAMVSSHHLYKVIQDLDEQTLEQTRDTLNEMAKHAQAVIDLGKDHPAFDGDAGFISDAETILKEAESFRKLLNAMGDSVSGFDQRS